MTTWPSQLPVALAVSLSQFTPRAGGGLAFYIRRFLASLMNEVS